MPADTSYFIKLPLIDFHEQCRSLAITLLSLSLCANSPNILSGRVEANLDESRNILLFLVIQDATNI